MSKKFEERTCIVCGKKWIVEAKPGVKHPRCMCDECIHSLTLSERQMYYGVYEGTHFWEHRVCLNCGKEWDVVTAKEKEGKRKRQTHFCSECCNVLTESQKKVILKDKLEGYKESKYREKRESRIRNYKHYIWKKAKDRATKNNLNFDIEESDIIVPDVCPILEVPLQWGTKEKYEYSPSLDRIDTTKGYVKGNVWVISKKANSMKNSATFEELQLFCKNILRYSLTNREKEPVESEDKELQR